MKYIHATRGAVIAFVVFALAAWLLPSHGGADDVQTILTISTFLFAIVSGFFLSRLNDRYNQVRELVASEDAKWLSFYETSVFLGDDFQKRIADIIDEYYIIAYDFDLGKYYKHNAPHVHRIYTELNKVKNFKNDVSSESFDELVGLLEEVERDRNESTVLSSEKVTLGKWSIMIILGGIIIFSIYYLRVDELYSHAIAVMLSSVLVLILLVMRDLQNFRLGGKPMVEESGEEVFESMGKMRYYNRHMIDQGFNLIPPDVTEYRLGLHKPGEEFEIKIINKEGDR